MLREGLLLPVSLMRWMSRDMRGLGHRTGAIMFTRETIRILKDLRRVHMLSRVRMMGWLNRRNSRTRLGRLLTVNRAGCARQWSMSLLRMWPLKNLYRVTVRMARSRLSCSLLRMTGLRLNWGVLLGRLLDMVELLISIVECWLLVILLLRL